MQDFLTAELGYEAAYRLLTCCVVPRPIALECTLERIVERGDATGHAFVIGRVECFRIRSDVMADGAVDPRRLRPLARLGRGRYARHRQDGADGIKLRCKPLHAIEARLLQDINTSPLRQHA